MIKGYLKQLRTAQDKLNPDTIQAAYHVIKATHENNGKLLICGNGGSAALASHMAIDFIKSCDTPIQAISLTDNTAALTAIGNDIGHLDIFAYPLEHLCTPNDLVIGISTSGASMNIVRAIEVGRQKGAQTLTFTGKAGIRARRPLHTQAHIAIIVESVDYGIIEDIHLSIMHSICRQLKKEN